MVSGFPVLQREFFRAERRCWEYLLAYGQRNALPRAAFPDEHRLQFVDSVSWVHGNHALKFGVDISPVHELLINLFNGGGVYSYNFSDYERHDSRKPHLQAWVADLYNLPLSQTLASNAAKCIVGGVDVCIGVITTVLHRQLT